jgi:hypothetical protein
MTNNKTVVITVKNLHISNLLVPMAQTLNEQQN